MAGTQGQEEGIVIGGDGLGVLTVGVGKCKWANAREIHRNVDRGSFTNECVRAAVNGSGGTADRNKGCQVVGKVAFANGGVGEIISQVKWSRQAAIVIDHYKNRHGAYRDGEGFGKASARSDVGGGSPASDEVGGACGGIGVVKANGGAEGKGIVPLVADFEADRGGVAIAGNRSTAECCIRRRKNDLEL